MIDCFHYVGLDKPEFFIAFVSHDFPEESYLVVFLAVFSDSVDNACSPFNDEILEAVPLIEVCVHVLLHCFSGKFIFFAFLIIFDLLNVDIVNHIKKLFLAQ